MRRFLVIAFFLLALAGSGLAQSRLLIGGRHASYGVQRPVVARPLSIPLVAGGPLSVAPMGLGDDCLGYVSARPDVIIVHEHPAVRLVLRVAGRGADTTLVVHAPHDVWLCDDDSHDELDPRIEIGPAPPGQYDVWVGSFRAHELPSAELGITLE